jgi:acyl-CoA thioesterase
MADGFDDQIALTAKGDGVWRGAIAPGWDTPRGPLGGYVMAILMRGLELAVADPERQARSVTMHFLRVPEAGPVKVSAVLEREGRSLSSVSGRLEQDGKLVGLALGAYSKPWEGPLLEDLPMPKVDPPQALEEAPDPRRGADERRGAQPPPFTERLLMQSRFGERPFTGAEDGESGGWIGLTEDRPVDALALAVLADAWYPAPWPRLAGFAPAPTVDLTLHIRSPLPVQGPLLGRFTNAYVRDGFFDEDGVLWSADGTVVAQSRQLGLLLGAEA